MCNSRACVFWFWPGLGVLGTCGSGKRCFVSSFSRSRCDLRGRRKDGGIALLFNMIDYQCLGVVVLHRLAQVVAQSGRGRHKAEAAVVCLNVDFGGELDVETLPVAFGEV